MEVLGFNFTKISAERTPQFKQDFTVNTHIEFTDLTKEEVAFLKDKDALRLCFKFIVTYTSTEGKKEHKGGELIYEGNVILAAEKEISKEMFKGWKKQEVPINIRIPIFNLILKKCTIHSLELEDTVGLPIHAPIPQLAPKTENNSK